MKAKNILMICLFISGLFCLPSKAQQPGETVSPQTIDQITECYNTTGDYDFQIKVYARDMKDYQDFMLNTLGNIDCIGSLHSIIVIGEIKDSHYIPVNQNKEKRN